MPEQPEEFEDYQHWIGQVDAWPSSKAGEQISIWNMNPSHAISAYRKLLRWAIQRPPQLASPDYEDVKRSPLAMALLNQAVGFEVVYSDDLPEVGLDGRVVDPFTDVDLERAYDALVELDAHQAASGRPLHILTRARVLHAALTRKEDRPA